MEKFSKEMLKKLANQVMFELSDSECEELQEDFETYLCQIDLLNKINTDGVEEMVYPFETPTVYLREDEEDHTITQQQAMSNATKSVQGHFSVPKVVK